MPVTIGIVGAGTMGAGIAHVAALQHCNVSLYDVNEEIIRNGINRITRELQRGVDKEKVTKEDMDAALKRIHMRTHIADLDTADIIIEAVLEDIRTKRDLFRRLDTIAHHTAILATNTSSLSVTAIAAGLKKPERVIGMHFFNPVHRMKLVEIIAGERTNAETVAKARSIAEQLGKVCVDAKDTPGFIVNRVARPFYGEALRILGEGIAPAATIDRIVRSEGGFAMGPFELMDLIGIDVNLAVTQSVYERFFHDPRYRPHPIQQRMVESGKLGRKSKHGFYDYEETT